MLVGDKMRHGFEHHAELPGVCDLDLQSTRQDKMRQSNWSIWHHSSYFENCCRGRSHTGKANGGGCFISGEIPTDCKESFILNLYKGKSNSIARDKNKSLKITDKVMELLERVSDFYIRKSNIGKMQFDFMPGRSTAATIDIVLQLHVKCITDLLHFHRTGSAFIKPDQRNPWIKDQIKITLLPMISHLLLPNFVSCGRACPSHMTQNLVTVGAKLWTADRFIVDPWSMDYADPVW